MGRIFPYIDSIGVADHGWASFSSKAGGRPIIYPRAKGVGIKELTIPEITLTLHCWSIFNSVQTKENRMRDIANRFTPSTAYTVDVSHNTYNNAYFQSFNVEQEDKLWVRYSFTFLLGDQGTTTITANLKDGAGTMAVFTVQNSKVFGYTLRTAGEFQFWAHQFGTIGAGWNQQVHVGNIYTIKPLGGGVINLTISGWVIGPDTATRQNIEKFFYSMARDPVGRTGTLLVSGNSYENCFMSGFDMDAEDTKCVNYSAQFTTTTKEYT